MNHSSTYSPTAEVDGVSLLATLADFVSKSDTVNAHQSFSTPSSFSGSKRMTTSSILNSTIYQGADERNITVLPKDSLDVKRRPAKKRAMPADFHFGIKDADTMTMQPTTDDTSMDAKIHAFPTNLSNTLISSSLPTSREVTSNAMTQIKSKVAKTFGVSSPHSSSTKNRLSNKAKTSSKLAKTKRSSNVDPPPSFPTVLMAILSSPQTNADAISFLSDDQRFIVSSPMILEQRVLPQYFGEFRDKSLKVTSFTQFEFMLRIWGFRRESDPMYPQINVWKHEMFKKGDWETCLKIDRPSQEQVQDFHDFDDGNVFQTLHMPRPSNDFISQEAEIIALKTKLAHLRHLQSITMEAHPNSSNMNTVRRQHLSKFPAVLGMTNANVSNSITTFNPRVQPNRICLPLQSKGGRSLRRSSLLASNAVNGNVSFAPDDHLLMETISRHYSFLGSGTAAKAVPSDVAVRSTTNEVVSAAIAALKNQSIEGVPPPASVVPVSAARNSMFPPPRRHTIDTLSNMMSSPILHDSSATTMMFRN